MGGAPLALYTARKSKWVAAATSFCTWAKKLRRELAEPPEPPPDAAAVVGARRPEWVDDFVLDVALVWCPELWELELAELPEPAAPALPVLSAGREPSLAEDPPAWLQAASPRDSEANATTAPPM
jgi:hypothetical protein